MDSRFFTLLLDDFECPAPKYFEAPDEEGFESFNFVTFPIFELVNFLQRFVFRRVSSRLFCLQFSWRQI